MLRIDGEDAVSFSHYLGTHLGTDALSFERHVNVEETMEIVTLTFSSSDGDIEGSLAFSADFTELISWSYSFSDLEVLTDIVTRR